jgi:hypothetical protein
MNPNSKLNAFLAISLCALTIFILKVAFPKGGSPDLDRLNKALNPTASYMIRITGDSGVKFQGSYMIQQADGSSSLKSVDGYVPQEYFIEGHIASCSFQKDCENGKLRIALLRNGEKVKVEETTAPYGVVMAAN